jgi:hypothetical protein
MLRIQRAVSTFMWGGRLERLCHSCTLPAQYRTLPAQYRTVPAQYRTVPEQYRTVPHFTTLCVQRYIHYLSLISHEKVVNAVFCKTLRLASPKKQPLSNCMSLCKQNCTSYVLSIRVLQYK